jgi:ectoine hydroxylase-related dioxygenase (phytanoyl-CoA dioxygenase family)
MVGLTQAMRRELDEVGFTVLEGLLRGPELLRVASAVRAVAEHGDGGAVAPIALEMMAYEPVLPYLVDAMGWNIHMRDGLFACYPPESKPVDFGRLRTGWHMDQQEEFRGVTHDGRVPLMELKVSYFLSDASADGHAATCLVPGSHLWTPRQRVTWDAATVPVVPLRVPAGSVLLWRSTLLHSVTPHQSSEWRLHLMYSYVPRWFRPSFRGTFANISTDPSLVQRCDPVRRQVRRIS